MTTEFFRKTLPIKPDLVVKWPGRTLDEGFTPFPKRLLRCLDRVFDGPSAINHLRIILAIADYARPNMTRLPSFIYLAFTAGMPVEEFRKGITEIQNKGWITIRGSEDGATIGLDGLVRLIEKLTADPEEAEQQEPF